MEDAKKKFEVKILAVVRCTYVKYLLILDNVMYDKVRCITTCPTDTVPLR